MRKLTTYLTLLTCIISCSACSIRYTKDEMNKDYYVEWCSPLPPPFRIISVYELHESCDFSSQKIDPKVIRKLLVEEVGMHDNWRNLDESVEDIIRALDSFGCTYFTYNPDNKNFTNIDNLRGLRIYINATSDKSFLTGTKEILIITTPRDSIDRPAFIEYKLPKEL